MAGIRADYVSGQEVWTKQGDKNDWLNKYFNTAAFQKNAPGTFGNTPRNLLRGPRTNSWDLGISKNWRFYERYRLQFRWEMFNAFNTPSFANPSKREQRTIRADHLHGRCPAQGDAGRPEDGF